MLLIQAVGPQFLAQCAPVDTQYLGGAAVVAARIAQHGVQQRRLDLAQRQRIQVARHFAGQVLEVALQRALHADVQGLGVGLGAVHTGSVNNLFGGLHGFTLGIVTSS